MSSETEERVYLALYPRVLLRPGGGGHGHQAQGERGKVRGRGGKGGGRECWVWEIGDLVWRLGGGVWGVEGIVGTWLLTYNSSQVLKYAK